MFNYYMIVLRQYFTYEKNNKKTTTYILRDILYMEGYNMKNHCHSFNIEINIKIINNVLSLLYCYIIRAHELYFVSYISSISYNLCNCFVQTMTCIITKALKTLAPSI